jgi:hypothetical protein
MNPEHLGDVRLSKVQFQAVDFELIAQGVGRPGGSLVGSPVRGIWIPAHGDVDIPECQEASNVLETWFLHEGTMSQRGSFVAALHQGLDPAPG